MNKNDKHVSDMLKPGALARSFKATRGGNAVSSFGSKPKLTKEEYMRHLTARGIPERMRATVPASVSDYGWWLRKNRPQIFNHGYVEWRAENEVAQSVGTFHAMQNKGADAS